MMKKIYIILSVLILTSVCFCFTSNLFAQSKATIENIDFYAEGMNLVIKYDIVKAKEGELFEIWVKITLASGATIIPRTMTGDVGSAVSAGPNKRIVWNLEEDNATIDEEFSVEVFAKSNEETAEKEEPVKPVKEKKAGISVGGAIALSALLPGLGKTVAKGGGAQWIWGLVGYGCVAGTVVMNNNAADHYENYKIATTSSERDDYFKEAENAKLYSNVFLGAAVTIWVIDLITTGVQAGKVRKSKNSNFSLKYNYDPYSKKPLIGFSYKF